MWEQKAWNLWSLQQSVHNISLWANLPTREETERDTGWDGNKFVLHKLDFAIGCPLGVYIMMDISQSKCLLFNWVFFN